MVLTAALLTVPITFMLSICVGIIFNAVSASIESPLLTESQVEDGGFLVSHLYVCSGIGMYIIPGFIFKRMGVRMMYVTLLLVVVTSCAFHVLAVSSIFIRDICEIYTQVI